VRAETPEAARFGRELVTRRLSCVRAANPRSARRRVPMDARPVHVGKESNSIEARMRGEVESEDDYLNRYDAEVVRMRVRRAGVR
jgi:hypothetical protein